MIGNFPIDAMPLPYKFRVDDYVLLDKSRAFKDYAKTELIEGVIIGLQAHDSPHSRVQTKLLMALSAACDRLDDEVQPWVELSVAIAPDTMPLQRPSASWDLILSCAAQRQGDSSFRWNDDGKLWIEHSNLI